MKKNTHGGKRSNSGRKKMSYLKRKVAITVWPTGEQVKKAGGKKRSKLLAFNAICEAGKIS